MLIASSSNRDNVTAAVTRPPTPGKHAQYRHRSPSKG